MLNRRFENRGTVPAAAAWPFGVVFRCASRWDQEDNRPSAKVESAFGKKRKKRFGEEYMKKKAGFQTGGSHRFSFRRCQLSDSRAPEGSGRTRR